MGLLEIQYQISKINAQDIVIISEQDKISVAEIKSQTDYKLDLKEDNDKIIVASISRAELEKEMNEILEDVINSSQGVYAKLV